MDLKQKRIEQAEPRLKRALAISEMNGNPDPVELATTLRGLATVADAQGKSAVAGLLMKRAADLQGQKP
jgi:hypothetical protein